MIKGNRIIFIGGFGYGGSERQMVTLSVLFDKAGYTVFYLNFGQKGQFDDRLLSSNVEVVNIPHNRFLQLFKLTIPFSVIRLVKLIIQKRISVGVSFLGECNYVNCIAAKWFKNRYRAITGLRNARKSLLLSRREQFFARYERYAYRKVSNSLFAKELYTSVFARYAPKIDVIYNVVFLPPVQPEYTRPKDDRIHVLIAASYRTVKNLSGLMSALKIVPADYRSRFIIDWYGDKTNAEYDLELLEDRIISENLSSVIRLHNTTKRILNRMLESDVIGLFSTSEGLPNAVCEGMMLGKPVIMSRVSDYSVLIDDTNGWLCDAEDSGSISNALVRMVNCSRDQLLSMGAISKAKARKLFDKDEVFRKWESLINSE